MSMTLVILLVVVIILVLLWRTAMKSRENAMIFAQRTCKNWGVLLLDDTVALSKLRIRKSHGQWHIWREYGFEFTYEGSKRYQAYLLFKGYQLEQVVSCDVDIIPQEVDANTQYAPPRGNNVIDLAEYQRNKSE